MSDSPSSSPPPSLEEQEAKDQVTFDLRGMLDGARSILPLAMGDVFYGVVFGVLAQQAGMSVLEVLLMSAFVFAGSAQLIVLGLWAMPLPIGAILLTTLIVNARHLLMGVAVSRWFLRLPPLKAYSTLFFLTDENWALMMGEFDKGNRNAAFLLGSGLLSLISWTSSTVLGRIFGGLIVTDPAKWGLDFAFTAVFLTLLVGLWKGKSNLLPWIVAAIVAVAAARFLPGKWYILLGGLAGSLAGAIRIGGEYAD